MLVDVLEPLLAFFVSAKTFAEVSRLAVVSKALRRVSLNAFIFLCATAHQLNLSGFAESVTDRVHHFLHFFAFSQAELKDGELLPPSLLLLLLLPMLLSVPQGPPAETLHRAGSSPAAPT